MIDRGHDLPITKQAEVLRISRGSIYYLPRPVPEADLAIMRHLDRLHLEFPFAGSTRQHFRAQSLQDAALFAQGRPPRARASLALRNHFS